MPSGGIQHAESVAGLSRFLDRIARLVCFADEMVDDPIQMLIQGSGCGRRKDQGIVYGAPAILLKASEKPVADHDSSFFVVLWFEAKLRLEPNGNGFLVPVDILPLRDRGLADAETSPHKETDQSLLGLVRDPEHRSDLFF